MVDSGCLRTLILKLNVEYYEILRQFHLSVSADKESCPRKETLVIARRDFFLTFVYYSQNGLLSLSLTGVIFEFIRIEMC